MKVFVVAAVGAALLSGCAPFEHGHYSEDVSYRNTVGDPPGTPLVYHGGAESFTRTAERSVSRDAEYRDATGSYARYGGSVIAQNAYTVPVHRSVIGVQPQGAALAYGPATVASTPGYSALAYAPAPHGTVLSPAAIQPAQQSTYASAPSYGSSATTYGAGGVRYDADGYAICEIEAAQHAYRQTARSVLPRF